MKAYHVYDPNIPEDEMLAMGLIIYAETRGKAKAKYLKKVYRGSWTSLVAHRLPDLD